MKLKITYILLIISYLHLNAQINLKAFTDVGHNNLSENIYLKTGFVTSYDLNEYKFNAGFRFDVFSPNDNVFTGININVIRNFKIKDNNFSLSAFYLYSPYSYIVNETNYGLIFIKNLHHFTLNAGLGFKNIAYSKKAVNEYNLKGNQSVNENFNLLYSIEYQLKDAFNIWNVGLKITNTDYFVINQATNPVMNINGVYNLNSKLQLFAEVWYQTAGAFNLHTNYFGLFFRPGIIWKIK